MFPILIQKKYLICIVYFSGCIALEDLNLSSFNARSVKNMSRMFSGCISLKYFNISNFNILKVLYMSNLFNGNTSLQKINISNFNTQNFVNMDDMFEGCTSLFPQNIICNAPAIRKVNYFRIKIEFIQIISNIILIIRISDINFSIIIIIRA